MPDYWPDLVYPDDEWPDEIQWREPPANLLLFKLTLYADIRLGHGDLIGINHRQFRIYRVRFETPGMGYRLLLLELYDPRATRRSPH